jgi:hypothetical protein
MKRWCEASSSARAACSVMSWIDAIQPCRPPASTNGAS